MERKLDAREVIAKTIGNVRSRDPSTLESLAPSLTLYQRPVEEVAGFDEVRGLSMI